MVSILLTILKISGMVLLGLLGAVLVILILVLTVPVRYKISAHRRISEEAPAVVDVRITWLLHILNGAFFYPNPRFRVRVLCFTLFCSNKEKKPKSEKEPSKKKAAGRDADRDPEKNSDKAPDSPGAMAEKGQDKEQTKRERKDEAQTKQEGQDEEQTKQEGQDEERTEQEESEAEKRHISDFFRKLFSALKNIKYTITQICDKIKHIVNHIQYYLAILKSETFRRAWTACSGEALALLKKLRPKKFTGQLHIGTGDPASTGQILAVYGILYPLLGNHIDVAPDFEQQIIEGELFVKGKVTVFRMLRTAAVIFFNRDLRRLIKLFKREAV